MDPWPAIRERALAGGRRSRRIRLVPRTRAGWVLATLLVLLFATAAYAVAGLTESGLTIEEASLRRGESGDEITVRVRATGSANLPECFLVEGPAMEAMRRSENGGDPPKGRLDSVWPDDDLTESWDAGDTTVFVFHEGKDLPKDTADPRRTSFYAMCTAGTGPGGTGPGIRDDEAHVGGTPEGEIPPPPSGEKQLVRKDMTSQQIRPPVATLSSGKETVEGAAGPYCWSPGSKSEEEDVLWCWNETGAEGQVPDERDALSVAAGSTMVLGFGGRPRLDSVMAGASPLFYGDVTGQPGKDLRTIRRDGRFEIPADPPAGEYLVHVHVFGPEGEADYAFRVAVEGNVSERPSADGSGL